MKDIPAGSVIGKVYYVVPDGSAPSQSFDTWDEAVFQARKLRAELITRLAEAGGRSLSEHMIRAVADRQVEIQLRWLIQRPDGALDDRVVQRWTMPNELRTNSEVSDQVDRFRVVLVVGGEQIEEVVTAPSPGDAATILGDQLRTRRGTPVLGVSDIRVTRLNLGASNPDPVHGEAT